MEIPNDNNINSRYTVSAWDVGIKTLSYCIIEFDNNNLEYWNVKDLGQINLLSSITHQCNGNMVKNNIKCTGKATFMAKDINGVEYYYCGTHKKQFEPNYNEIDYFKKITNKEIFPCSTCSVKKVTKRSAYYCKSDDNLIYYCTQHMKQQSKKLSTMTKLVKIKKTTCNMASSNLQQLGEKMFAKFNATPSLFNVNKIRIENQPSLINPLMKSLSMLLFSYGIQRKMMEGSIIQDISFIAPSSKLKVSFDIMQNIINNIKDTEKLSNLFNKLFRIAAPTIEPSKYNEIFNNNYKRFLTHVAMKVVNKKYNEYESFMTEYEGVITEEDKNSIIKLFQDIHTKEENKLIYDITKALSIKYALIALSAKGHAVWVDLINSHNKQDDLTDAFLLCLNCKGK
jgi:hypothetical protein